MGQAGSLEMPPAPPVVPRVQVLPRSSIYPCTQHHRDLEAAVKLQHSEITVLSLCVFSIHSSTCTFILHSFAPSEIHLTSISLCPLKGKPLRTLQRHQYLPHSFYRCADIMGEQHVPPGRVDYFELKSLEKQLVQKGPLTLPSVSLIAGNKSPM